VQLEEERNAEGELVPCQTIFLAGRECPFTCVFCDLWQYTLQEAIPPGAIPTQIERAFKEHGRPADGATIKLYNASNFFDERAVPRVDWPAIADLLQPFARVVVESHPRLVTGSCGELAELLAGRLEVAMGLETVHPEALPRLNKQMTLETFDRAASYLRTLGVGLRSFVMVGAPFVRPADAVEWAVRSAEHALQCGSDVVSLIPARGGNGEMERLSELGLFSPPTTRQLEAALEGSLQLQQGVVLVDLWDAERLAGCPECRAARIDRMARLNRCGGSQPPIDCAACESRTLP
jgi:radical SAM enzyme (TIGR01210 family)